MKNQRGGEMSFWSYLYLMILGSALYFVSNSLHWLMQ